jgi:glycosyltransferase involved in cell wall biosynthesis
LKGEAMSIMRMDLSGAVKAEPVSVVLPSFNEEAAVAQEIEKIRRVLTLSGIGHEIIVVDDGSTDRTAERAAQAGARVIRHVDNRGYGAAIKTGVRAASYDAIVISDTDGTYPADEIPALLKKLRTADMVVGARTGAEVHVPLVRRPAKWVLNWVAARVAGRHIPDLNSGLRAFRGDVARQYFSILSNRFSFTSTVTLALLADDYRVVYHPINYYARIGRSKIMPWHFMDFLMLVLRMAVLFQPLKVFLPIAVSFMSLGVLKTIYDVLTFFPRTATTGWSFLYLPVLSTSAILFVLVGVQLLLVGLVSDGVLRRIAQQNTPLIVSRGIVGGAEALPGADERQEEIVGAGRSTA